MNSASPSDWDTHLLASPEPQFLQSTGWAAFQESLGRTAVYLSDAEKTYQGLGIRIPLAGNMSYLFFPRGPIVRDAEALLRFRDDAKAQCKKNNILFFRCEPIFSPTCEMPIVPDFQSSAAIHPQESSIVDLTRSEDELLSRMHPKTRYNIRHAERQGVTVAEGISEDARCDFFRLIEKTAERQSFNLHPAAYYRTLFDFFAAHTDTLRVRLYSARYHDICIASICTISFGPMTTYIHGGSDHDHRELMAPSLLQWHAMREEKKQDAQRYDLWGITTSSDPAHPWRGITRFKNGFGGAAVAYPGTFDVPCSTLYPLYAFARRVLRKR